MNLFKKNKKPKTKLHVDYLQDAVSAVQLYDDVRLKRITSEVPMEVHHGLAVIKIKLCNRINGKGYISISKARNYMAMRWNDNKAY